MSSCSSTPHPVPRSRQAGNAGHQMGARWVPACQPVCQGGLTDEGRPDESRRSWLPRHSNPMLSGAAHRPASWSQGACGLGSGSRWAGLGWAKVVPGRQRSLDTTTLQAGPHPRRRLRLPAWSTMSCSTSVLCLRWPRWKVRGRKTGTGAGTGTEAPEIKKKKKRHLHGQQQTTDCSGGPPVRSTGLLIDNLGSHAAGSWTVRIRIHPIFPLTLILTTQTTILGSTTCSSHVPIATARQFHA